MDNFYIKYLKYKNKYLTLQNYSKLINQVGGATPALDILKDINLFEDERIAEYLNPFHGAVLYRTSFIKNYYLLYNDEYNKYIKQIFYIIPNSFELNPTKILKDLELSTEIQHNFLIYIGMYLAYNYIIMIIKKEQHQIEDKLTNAMIRDLNDIIIAHVEKMKGQGIDQTIFDLVQISNDYDLLYSYILLSLVWSIAKDKNGIFKYYTGIKNIFNKIIDLSKKNKKLKSLNPFLNLYNFEIKDNKKFLSTFYLKNQIILNKKIPFEDAFFKLFDNFYLFQVGTVMLEGFNSYSDCGETSLRNFINIICYDKVNNNFDISKLIKLKAIGTVIEYYTKYNNLISQHNGREDWARITINIPNVKYASPNNTEIGDGLNSINEQNMLTVIKHLFQNITKWDDFKLVMKDDDYIKLDLNFKGFGKIIIKYNNHNYIWHLQYKHYELNEQNEFSEADINYKNIAHDYQKRFILKSHNIYNLFDYLLSPGTEDKKTLFTNKGFLYFNFMSVNVEAIPVNVIVDGRQYTTNKFKYPIIHFFNIFFNQSIFSPDNETHRYIYAKLFSNIMNVNFNIRIIPEININIDLLKLCDNIKNLYINSNDNSYFTKLLDNLIDKDNTNLENVIININNLNDLNIIKFKKFKIKNLSLIHTLIEKDINIDIKFSEHIYNKNIAYNKDFPNIFENELFIQKLLLTTELQIVSLPTNLKELCLYLYDNENLSKILPKDLTKLVLNKYNKTLKITHLKQLKELYLYNFVLSDKVILDLPNVSKIEILYMPSSGINEIVMLFKSACKQQNCLPNIKKLGILQNFKNTLINEDTVDYKIEEWIKSKTKKPDLVIEYI